MTAKQTIAYAAKFVTALVTAAAITVNLGLFAGTAAKWVAVGIAFAGALGVYAIPNKTPGGQPCESTSPPATAAPPPDGTILAP
jgi:hypothetical protein